MTGPEIQKVLLELVHRIAPECDPANIDPDENLREALEIDSFDFLNLLVSVHERLGIAIPESDYSRVATLNNLVTYLQDAGA